MIFHSGDYVDRFVSLLIHSALEWLVKPHDVNSGGSETTSVDVHCSGDFNA